MSRSFLALGAVLVVTGGARVAGAETPTGAGRIVSECRKEPDAALCREVRRMCATREVRDEVVPACKELGWYGDTLRARIVNLCPLDAGHPACVEMRAACEEGRAEAVEEGAPALCREMGWGPYAWQPAPLPGTGGAVVIGEEGDEGGEEDGGGIGEIVDADATDRARMGAFTDDPGGAIRDGDARPGFTLRPPRGRAGLSGVGFRLGLAFDRPEGDLATAERSYGALITWQSFALAEARWPLAGALELELSSADGFAYHGALLAGPGRWLRQDGAAALLAGVSVDGLDAGDESVPLAAFVPVRAAAQVNLGGVTLAGWAQVAWQVAGDERAAAASWSAVDQLSVGGTLLLGRRDAANAPMKGRLWFGGVYEERGAVRILAFVVGFGSAQEPWNQ